METLTRNIIDIVSDANIHPYFLEKMPSKLPFRKNIQCPSRRGFRNVVLENCAPPRPQQVPEIHGVLLVLMAEHGQVLAGCNVVAHENLQKAIVFLWDAWWREKKKVAEVSDSAGSG